MKEKIKIFKSSKEKPMPPLKNIIGGALAIIIGVKAIKILTDNV